MNMTTVYYAKEKDEQDQAEPCPEYNGNHTRQRLVSLSLSDIPRVFNNTDVDYLLTSQGPCYPVPSDALDTRPHGKLTR